MAGGHHPKIGTGRRRGLDGRHRSGVGWSVRGSEQPAFMTLVTFSLDRAYPGRGSFLSHALAVRRTRGRSRSPASHSSKRAVLTIALPSESTRRKEPHRQHRSSHGSRASLVTPVCPHGHVTRISMELHPKNSPGYPGLKSHRGISDLPVRTRCEARLRSHQGQGYRVRQDGARPPCRVTRLKAHSCEDEKAPGDAGGEVCVDGRGSRSPAAPSS
jgi:hypothetical protein